MVGFDAFFPSEWSYLLSPYIAFSLCPSTMKSAEISLEMKISFLPFRYSKWSRQRCGSNFFLGGLVPLTNTSKKSGWLPRFSLSTLYSHEVRDKETVSLWTQGWGHTFKIMKAAKTKREQKANYPSVKWSWSFNPRAGKLP